MAEPDNHALVVNRWRKHGRDRLYVQQVDGTRLGYWDLEFNKGFPAEPDLQEVLEDVALNWRVAADRRAAHATPVSQYVPRVSASTPRKRRYPTRGAVLAQLPSESLTGSSARAGLYEDPAQDMAAAQLSHLMHTDPRWMVEHTAGFGGERLGVDHLVVGPGGVFVVASRLLPESMDVVVDGDTLTAGDTEVPWVQELVEVARFATELVSAAAGSAITVHGLLVLTGEHDLSVTGDRDGVEVLRHTACVPWLVSLGDRLADSDLLEAFGAARQPSTWPLPTR